MYKIIFILAMLFSQTLFAATLTPNTIPYVCQGGATPQLCNSNMTTDSSGNVNSILGKASTGTTYTYNTIYGPMSSDGFVVHNSVWNCAAGATIVIVSDSTSTPSGNYQQAGCAGFSGISYGGISEFVRKGDYWEAIEYGSNSQQIVRWQPIG